MAIIALPAVLTLADARATLAHLQAALTDDPAPVLDAGALQTLDSAAIAVLLECRRAALTRGATLRIVGLPDKAMALARLYGVDALLGDVATA